MPQGPDSVPHRPEAVPQRPESVPQGPDFSRLLQDIQDISGYPGGITARLMRTVTPYGEEKGELCDRPAADSWTPGIEALYLLRRQLLMAAPQMSIKQLPPLMYQ